MLVRATTWTYAYRGDGLRDSATTGATTRTFTWDVNAGLPVILDDGAQYIYGAGLVAQVSGANTNYYLADGLGSTMATTDASGNVVTSYTYDVYGKTTASSGSQANDFQFAGQQTDPTGLQYLRARYYDPEGGGFLSRDPLAAAPAWGAHPFTYSSNAPAGLSDPSGLKPIDETGCALDDEPCHAASAKSAESDSVCNGLYYYTWQFCRDQINSDWLSQRMKGAYYGAIIRAARPLLGEYHNDLVKCVQDSKCRQSWDGFFASTSSAGLDQAAQDAANASP